MATPTSTMTHPGQMPAVRRGRHIGKWPVIIAGTFATVILLGVIYGGIHRLGEKQRAGEAVNDQSIASTGSELQDYLGRQDEGFIDSIDSINLQIQGEPPEKKDAVPKEKTRTSQKPQKPEISTEEKALLAYREQQVKLYLSALTAGTDVKATEPQGSGQVNPLNSLSGGRAFPGSASLDSLRQQLSNLEPTPSGDPNYQDSKLAFASRTPSTTRYVNSGRQDQIVDYEIKTGTVIPAVMISGLNSDLPGQIIGQVAQNVYDTATGRYLLIPQGTRIYGDYDSQISYGQSRALVAWHRLIYPDGSAQELEGMQGYDQGGYAGFKDKVDNHYLRTFGSLLVLSLFNAIPSLLEDKQTSSSNTTVEIVTLTEDVVVGTDDDGNPITTTVTRQQAIPVTNSKSSGGFSRASDDFRETLAEQVAQVGTEITRKNLQIQPTIKIRQGYRFNIMINKDIAFEAPYEGWR